MQDGLLAKVNANVIQAGAIECHQYGIARLQTFVFG
jgi:hypothetical protein